MFPFKEKKKKQQLMTSKCRKIVYSSLSLSIMVDATRELSTTRGDLMEQKAPSRMHRRLLGPQSLVRAIGAMELHKDSSDVKILERRIRFSISTTASALLAPFLITNLTESESTSTKSKLRSAAMIST